METTDNNPISWLRKQPNQLKDSNNQTIKRLKQTWNDKSKLLSSKVTFPTPIEWTSCPCGCWGGSHDTGHLANLHRRLSALALQPPPPHTPSLPLAGGGGVAPGPPEWGGLRQARVDTERDPDHGQPMDGDGDATACTKGARVNLPGPRLDQGSGALPCDPP